MNTFEHFFHSQETVPAPTVPGIVHYPVHKQVTFISRNFDAPKNKKTVRNVYQ
jgi:hypothetical protein